MAPTKAQALRLYREDVKAGNSLLTTEQRRELLEPLLPSGVEKGSSEKAHSSSKIGVRRFLRTQLHAFIYLVAHTIFSLYIRIRQAYHAVTDRTYSILKHHHRTPELIQKDVSGLSRLPKHISVILTLEDGGRGGDGLEALVDEAAEIAAWCACIGIPRLSIYEKTGILKGYIQPAHRAMTRKLSSYLGPGRPALSLRAPHTPSIESASRTPTTEHPSPVLEHMSVLLLSAEDGRDSLVDLTITLTEMVQRKKIQVHDVTQVLIDAEMTETVMDEPDLLVLFSPRLELSGYPPWQLRLTEIFHVQDNEGVGYQVFLRALYSYANAQMRFGR